MKILVWNCRGMRNPTAVRALLGIQERLKPDVLFLSETHLDMAKAGKLIWRLGFDEMEVSESDERSGGLIMLWQTGLGVSSRAVHSNYIDIRIKETIAAGWRFTGFYSEPSSDRKHL